MSLPPGSGITAESSWWDGGAVFVGSSAIAVDHIQPDSCRATRRAITDRNRHSGGKCRHQLGFQPRLKQGIGPHPAQEMGIARRVQGEKEIGKPDEGGGSAHGN